MAPFSLFMARREARGLGRGGREKQRAAGCLGRDEPGLQRKGLAALRGFLLRGGGPVPAKADPPKARPAKAFQAKGQGPESGAALRSIPKFGGRIKGPAAAEGARLSGGRPI
jgi:hypothetical protein